MTERDWLKAKNPDLMLDVVTPRLTERKWYLMACMAYRRLITQMNESEPQQIIDHIEPTRESSNLGRLLTMPGQITLVEAEDTESSFAYVTRSNTRPAFEEHIRQLVKACDPDANESQYLNVAARKTNPAVLYFRAASEAARRAVESASLVSENSQVAMNHLIQLRGHELFDAMRECVTEGFRIIGRTNHSVALAIQHKTRGDELADKGISGNISQELAEQHAREMIGRTSFSSSVGFSRKEIGRILHEQIGNPFQRYRFEPRWRTDAVVQLAKIIYDNHAYDRYPILADALLDADCDEEPILRHVRGTEEHLKDVHHCRGCWVIDLILELDPDVYSHEPLYPSSTPRGRQEPLGLAEPGTHYA